MASSSKDTLSTGAHKEASLSQFSQEAFAFTGSQNSQLRVLVNAPPPTRRWYQRKKLLVAVGLVILIFVFLFVFLPIFFVVVRKKHIATTASTGAGGGSGTPNPGSPTGAMTGGDRSVIRLANGTTFVYSNPFGGYWVQDPEDPYNNNARPNSWTPPLNTSWRWGEDRVNGVNLGGLFVLEPFVTPDIFQRYPGAGDEYTLSVAMAADTANGGLQQLENHYDTFITEQDIAEIAGSGLNFLRIPIPFWAIETWPNYDEPFLAKTSWKYLLRVLDWARKYGLRVCLDLHTIPGSQNGYNHSGRLSPVNFLNGNMGIANAERALYYIRVLTEFISQPEYQNLIPVFGIINEPLLGLIGRDQMTSFYLRAHDMIRNITGYGEGHGPYLAIHDGFQATTSWKGFLEGSDRVILDGHPYFSFGGINPAPMDVIGPQGIAGGIWPRTACDAWGPSINQSRVDFGLYMSGEFAASPNDCGFWLHGVNTTSTGPNCPVWDDWASYSDNMKVGIKNFVMASMDAFRDWFFWTWKIAPNGLTGKIETPLWTYQLGLRNGWIPQDPREAMGMCQQLGTALQLFNGSYVPWQTGTTSSIPASSTTSYPWPPPTISNIDVPMNLLPTYTNTGLVVTLPPGTYTSAPASATQSVDGWFDAKDTEGGITTVSGCPYPDEWFGVFSVTPTAPCHGPSPTGE